MADPLNIAQPANTDFVKFGADELRTLKTLLTGAYAGFITAPNNIGFKLKESGGTARDVVKMTAANVIEIGNAANALSLLGTSFTFTGATLDAGTLDGIDSTGFARLGAVSNFTTAPTINGNVVWHAGNDGAGSGLDADLLDGLSSAYFLSASNLNAGTLLAARLPAFTGDVTAGGGSAALTIAANAVDLTKILDFNQYEVLGRVAAGAGDPVKLTAAQQISILLTADGAGSGLDADFFRGLAPDATETVSTIVQRDAAGRARFIDPAAAQDAATKAYTDAAILASAGAVLLSTTVAAASANITIAFPAGYKYFDVVFSNVVPATDNSRLYIRVNDGTGVKGGAGNYSWGAHTNDFAGGIVSVGSIAATFIEISDTQGIDNTAAGSHCTGTVRIFDPLDTTKHKYLSGNGMQADSTAAGWRNWAMSGAFILNTNALTQIQFIMSAGNITTGNFKLYGYK